MDSNAANCTPPAARLAAGSPSSKSLGCPAEPGCLWCRKAAFPRAALSCLHCELSISLSENSLSLSVWHIASCGNYCDLLPYCYLCGLIGIPLQDLQLEGQFLSNLIDEDFADLEV